LSDLELFKMLLDKIEELSKEVKALKEQTELESSKPVYTSTSTHGTEELSLDSKLDEAVDAVIRLHKKIKKMRG